MYISYAAFKNVYYLTAKSTELLAVIMCPFAIRRTNALAIGSTVVHFVTACHKLSLKINAFPI